MLGTTRKYVAAEWSVPKDPGVSRVGVSITEARCTGEPASMTTHKCMQVCINIRGYICGYILVDMYLQCVHT